MIDRIVNAGAEGEEPQEVELEVTLRDRLTRSTAKETVAFTVASGVR